MSTTPVTYRQIDVWPPVAMPVFSSRERSAILEIEDAVKGESVSPQEAVALILALRVTEPGMLDGVHCAGSRERYSRHLVYAGVGFSILALVWLPGQMSPIHGHRSWCALGVRQGTLVETSFIQHDAVSPSVPRLTLTACRELHPGMVSFSDGAGEHYHRVANLGVETAVSIHVYGVAFDRIGHGLNRIWEGEP